MRRPLGRRHLACHPYVTVWMEPRSVQLPDREHTSRPWRIHALTRDFRLEDVWALPAPGGPEDFPLLVEALAAGDPSQGSPDLARTLWAVRWKLGDLLGW